jgi:hypothetical protein
MDRILIINSLNYDIIWEEPGVDGRIILEWICKKWDVGVRTGMGWFRTGTFGGRL